MAEPLSASEEYELFGHPDTTQADCDFLHALVIQESLGSKPRLLDLACGTGRHALELAARGNAVTGVDLSGEMIAFARSQAERHSVTGCEFLVQDLRSLDLPRGFDIAYCLFNTLSLFTENDELLRIMSDVHHLLRPKGLMVVQLGNVWRYVAEGSFKTQHYENTYDRGALVRKERGSFVFARNNNVYRHVRTVRYIKDGREYPPETTTLTQRLLSLNEIDLLSRLTGFIIEEKRCAMIPDGLIQEWNAFEEDYLGAEMVLVLRKQEAG